ncbi:MAG: hypothetical protein FJ295_14955 [Planctomycetes bacterium]|nr:hypothetical protein [Planctomycetota bacterium]
MKRPCFVLKPVCWIGMLQLATVTMTWGQDFRVETEVLIGKYTEPVVKYLTLFVDTRVYEFRLTEPHETVIYDNTSRKIILLSSAQKTKTEIPFGELIDFTASMKAKVDESIPLLYFACNPEFTVDANDEGHALDLSSSWLSYQIQAESPRSSSSNAPARYQDYADWSARLSASRTGSLHLPPFARIEANRMVAAKGWIPMQVTRTVVANSRKEEMRTRHVTTWMLGDEDRRRVSKAGDQLVNFKPVTFAQYSQDLVASNSDNPRR